MKRVIATGIQDFEKLRSNGGFYVDKTEFIREWWNGHDDVTLIIRPRRFGKTLNMSTLNCFFSNKYANRGELFEGLKIWEDPAMREEQGKWPVITLSFAEIKQRTFEETRHSLNLMIENLYNGYEWMIKDERFTDRDRAYYDSVRADMRDSVAAVSLQRLSEWLYRYCGKKVLNRFIW